MSAQRNSTKRPRSNSGSGTGTGNVNTTPDERPKKIQHTQGNEDEQRDAAWSTMYQPLPSSMQIDTDHTKATSASGSAASASAAAAVGASSGDFIPALISSLVPIGQFETNYNSKLKDKNLMLDNSVASRSLGINAGDTALKDAKQRRRKRGIQMMSSNQRKKAGLTKIPKQDIKYSMFLPLHQLWVAYMHDILDPQNSRGLSTGERVLKADYHGAIFTVLRCRSPTHIGQRGIMIQETQETFQIVTEQNAVKILPKRHTIFAVTVPPLNPAANADSAASPASSPSPSPSPSSSVVQPHVFELYGDHMCFRSYERSARKFKAKATIEL